jgi:hypothetical protein
MRRDSLSLNGGKVTGIARRPLGTKDFGSQLVTASSSGVSILGLASFGTDAVGAEARRYRGAAGVGRPCRLRAKRRAKIAAGKKQMLPVLPVDLIKVVKITTIEDGLKLSGRSRRLRD